MKLKVLITSLTFAATATVGVAQEKVTVGEPSWPGARIMSRVIGQVIETRLGGEVGYAPGANAVIFEAMHGGRGDIDVHPDVWLPNQSSFTDKYVDGERTVALSSGSYEGRAGFCVPNYVIDRGITSVFQLGTPEAQAMFDSNGDGTGEIWAGASGWASTNIHLVKVRDYGLQPFLEPSTEDEAVFYARLRDAIAEEQAVAFYCYSPHYVHALYDVTILEEPDYDPEQYIMVAADQDADWFNKSSIMTGDEVKIVTVAYSRSLDGRNPAAAAFLAQIDMDARELSGLTYQVVVQGADLDETVSAWIDANADVVDGWLGLN